MAQLNVRLNDDTRDALDALARARGVTTSDLVRELIDSAVGHDDPQREPGDPTPVSLSAVERKGLALQHEALALLCDGSQNEDQAAYHRKMVKVLISGYTTEYNRMFYEMVPEMTRREAALVWDTLDMFTVLERSLAALSEQDRATLGERAEYALIFRGFDFNDRQESRLADYAHFMIEDGRWTYLADRFDAAHEHGNSHMPVLAAYERMLTAWRPLNERRVKSGGWSDLNRDELAQVLAAWPHPGR